VAEIQYLATPRITLVLCNHIELGPKTAEDDLIIWISPVADTCPKGTPRDQRGLDHLCVPGRTFARGK
jgi:hypothetical protein